MNGTVITNNPSQGTCATQYKELIKQLKIYAASNYSIQVSNSIDELKSLSTVDFLPLRITKDDNTVPETNAEGDPMVDENSEVVTKEDLELKKTLESVYNKGVDAADKRIY